MIYIGQSSMVAHSGTETSSFRRDLGLRATDKEQRGVLCRRKSFIRDVWADFHEGYILREDVTI
jgi:hypothetical protein